MTHEEHMANLKQAARELAKAMDQAGKEGWIVDIQVDVASDHKYINNIYHHMPRLSLKRYF